MADNTGTIIAAAVRPAASEDSYASAFANEIKGGFHSVADETARDAITEDRRQEGMLCYVIADDKIYQLVGGITNEDWVEYSVDVSGLVPYEGATTDVDLGDQSLKAGYGSIIGTNTGETQSYIEATELELSDGTKIPYLLPHTYVDAFGATIPYALVTNVVVSRQTDIGISPNFVFMDNAGEIYGGISVDVGNEGYENMDFSLQYGDGIFTFNSDVSIDGNITATNLSGTNTGDEDLSGLVPYTGAISPVDLGEQSLTTTSTVAGGLDSTFGSGTDYWAFSEVDFGGFGKVPLLSATGTFVMGTTIGAIADNLIIYDNSDSGAVGLVFVLQGLSSTSLSFDGYDLLLQSSFLPDSDDAYNLGGEYNQWQNLYVSGNIYVAGTALSTTDLGYLEGLDQSLTTSANALFNSVEVTNLYSQSFYMNAPTTGTQQFYQIDDENIWAVSYLATVVNFYNYELGDIVLQLQEDGDALLYRNLWVETGKIGIGYDGTSALVAGFQMNHIDGILSMGTLGSGYAGFKDAVTAMQWNPNTASFRVGRCSNGTAWDTLGNYSFSAGLDGSASGQSSMSLGQGNLVTGNFAVGIGFSNTASAAYSYAIGNDNTSQSSQNTFCFGQGNTSSGGPSMTLGFDCTASAADAIAIGDTATSSHSRSIVISAGTANASSDASNQIKLSSQYVDLVPLTYVRAGDLTNYSRISPTGDLAFIGSAGLYPRTLTQASAPAAGTGATQLDTGEMCIWIDSDDSKCYYCFNQGGTVKKVELT
jgi:hypothetical protein